MNGFLDLLSKEKYVSFLGASLFMRGGVVLVIRQSGKVTSCSHCWAAPLTSQGRNTVGLCWGLLEEGRSYELGRVGLASQAGHYSSSSS